MSNFTSSKAIHGEPGFTRTSNDVNSARKRVRAQAYSNQIKARKKQKMKKVPMPDISSEGILLKDVNALLERNRPKLNYNGGSQNHNAQATLPETFTEIDIEITDLSSTGDGLALASDGSNRVYVVPFTLPGDTVRAKIIRHVRGSDHSITDLVKVLKPSQDRDDTLIRCPYFASCSGCQFQMLPYSKQLLEKKRVIEKAYRNYSGLPSHAVPEIGATNPSPRQYGYRTKLTPHFDGPPGMRSKKKKGERPVFDEVPPIGFTAKNRRRILDIEDCPIGTEAVRLGIGKERKRVAQDIAKYRSGATILLRQTTKRLPKSPNGSAIQTAKEEDLPIDKLGEERVVEDMKTHLHEHTYTTNHKSSITEYVNDYVFSSPANAFFQNNNSILPEVTSYIRSHILGPLSDGSGSCSSTSKSIDNVTSAGNATLPVRIKNLVDAYCGSGLFTITLSSLFERSIGIDITADSVKSARDNLELNRIPQQRANFITADASSIFKELTLSSATSRPSQSPPSSPSQWPPQSLNSTTATAATTSAASADFRHKLEFEPDETAVVIDPPRKGCDLPFLRQLVDFGPARIVYMSCNVHTQARDIGVLVGGFGKFKEDGGKNVEDGGKNVEDGATAADGRTEENGKGETQGLYVIESIKGFDFFPQTSHVEVVAILQKKEQEALG